MCFPIHSTRSCVRVADAMIVASKIYFIPLFSGNSYPHDREAPSATAVRMTLPDPAPKSTSSFPFTLKSRSTCTRHVARMDPLKPATPPSAPPEIVSNTLQIFCFVPTLSSHGACSRCLCHFRLFFLGISWAHHLRVIFLGPPSSCNFCVLQIRSD